MARFEVITGADRQRHWSKDDKLSILREAFSPGAVVTVVARRHDIRVQQIYYWRKKFSVSKQAPVFLPVSVFDSELPIVGGAQAEAVTHITAISAVVEITLKNGRSLKLPVDLERGILASLVACVEGA
jgi:transposase